MKKVGRVTGLLLCLCLVMPGISVCAAPETSGGLDIQAPSAMLIEQSSGQVLFEKNPDEKMAPASVTKIMTMLLIIEALEQGKITLNDNVTVSEYAASMGGSQVYLEQGEQMSVENLLKAIAVASGNDASVAMAEFVSGSAQGFVAKMNERAKELGMQNTNFVNCTGLDDPNHYTTARDVALMSRELLKHEMITKYTTIWMDSLRDGKFGLTNTNRLVRFYDGCTGLKTGSTDGAKYCVSASAKRDGLHLIAVVMGGETSAKRFSDAAKMLDYGFANFALAHDDSAGNIQPVKVEKGVLDSVEVAPEKDLVALVPKGKDKLLEKTITIADSLNAPVEKNQKVGEIIYKIEGEEIGRVAIRAKEYVAREGYGGIFKKMVNQLFMA